MELPFPLDSTRYNNFFEKNGYRCGHSSYGLDTALSKLKTLLALVEDATEPMTPKQIHEEISKKMYITHSTVRKYLRRLTREQKIIQPYPSYYCSKVTYNVIVGELRVHNVRFVVRANFLGRFEKFVDVEEFIGDVRLFIQFGKQRRKLTGQISIKKGSRSKGLVKDTLLFALNRVLDLMEYHTNHVVGDGFVLSSFETNRDYPGKRLDGKIACLTKKQLFDVIERVYQKDEDVVRVERKISQDLKVEEAVSLLRGNLPDSNVAQGLMVLTKRIDGLNTRIGFYGREIAELNEALRKLVNPPVEEHNPVVGENPFIA